MVTKTIDSAMALSGAGRWGTVPFSALAGKMSPRAVSRANALCPGAAGVIAAAFPYYAGDISGNISLYARGEDYHLVLRDRLGRSCEALGSAFPGRRFVPLADASPLPEKQAAAMAGLGVIGRNTLLICEEYGSFVFLGCILTDMEFEDRPQAARGCWDCFECVRACPSGALQLRDGEVVFDRSLCISALTQIKGELSDWQEALIRAGGSAWGCDACQRACPMNRGAGVYALDEFKGKTEEYISSLALETLSRMDEEAFRSAYSRRAFSWRGKHPLERNLALLGGEEEARSGAGKEEPVR